MKLLLSMPRDAQMSLNLNDLNYEKRKKRKVVALHLKFKHYIWASMHHKWKQTHYYYRMQNNKGILIYGTNFRGKFSLNQRITLSTVMILWNFKTAIRLEILYIELENIYKVERDSNNKQNIAAVCMACYVMYQSTGLTVCIGAQVPKNIDIYLLL